MLSSDLKTLQKRYINIICDRKERVIPMKIDLKKEKFEQIESCFTSIKERRSNIPSATKEIEKILTEVFHKQMKILVITPKNKGDMFFVMSIFPAQSTIDKMVEAILNQSNDAMLRSIWNETDDWIIEIDNRLFNGDYIDLTAKELTALLLHEIGHMIYSNSVPQRISKVMRLEYARANLELKELVKYPLFKSVLKLPILNACTYDNYKTKDSIRKELKADVFVVKMGYGNELVSALNKFIANPTLTTSRNINKKAQDVYGDMSQVTLFSLRIVEDFQKRKNVVAKKNLEKMITDIPSVFIKSTISEINDNLNKEKGSMNAETRMEYVSETANRVVEDMYMREFFDFKWKRLKRIDPRQIDYIDMQKQNIRTNDDRMILINYIYTKLDTVNYYISILQNPKYAKKYDVPHSMDELVRYKTRLEKARDYVLSYQIPETRYGLDVIYPEGYEG